MKRKNNTGLSLFARGAILVSLLFSLTACAGTSEKNDVLETQGPQPATGTGTWTWFSGDSKTNRQGIYGTQGTAAAGNKPGGRSDAVSWIDPQGNLWLFGGYGFADKSIAQYLNDLWKFDGERWTWMSGDSTGSRKGVFGARGTAAPANKPGGREGAVSWIDHQGNLWLFGGYGYADNWYAQLLNDLWKFDGNDWTWVSGECKKDYPGVYGTRGVAENTNQPGARTGAVSWTDTDGNLWLFGGYGYDGYGSEGYLNDLWKFDGERWTWVGGDSTLYEMGDYGSRGVAAGSNKPGARSNAVGWTDAAGNLWLFGGYGNANISWKSSDRIYRNPASSGAGYLNDMWKFDGSDWTWVSGDKIARYHAQVAGETTDAPAARNGSVGWFGTEGNLWLFGGDARIRYGRVTDDLWKFDGTDWTRVYAASSHGDRQGNYGTRGVAGGGAIPGARTGAIGWTDSEGNFWLFGGRKPYGSKNFEYFNDLWKYEP